MSKETQRVFLVDPARQAGDLGESLSGLAVERIDPSELLPGRDLDVAAALVASDLGAAGPGLDLVREAVAAGWRAPLVLVTSSRDDALREAALRAGAAACVNISQAEGRDLTFALEFARSIRASVEERNLPLFSSLSSYLSHEGRNALAGIQSGVQVVSDHLPPGSSDLVMCGEIQERVREFGATLDALALALRPPTELSRAALDLATVARAEAACLVPEAEIDVIGEGVSVQANREQLGLLLSTLLGSAAKAMGGAGRIEVSVERDDEWCLVKLRDSAPARDVSEADTRAMLEAFTTPKGPRAGLGLAAARLIAEAHGGSLVLGCSPGCSLQGIVRLPLAKPNQTRP